MLQSDYLGHGYATEAAAAVLEFGFQKLGLYRIYAICRPENIGSANVMQKVRMKYEGLLRGHMKHKREWHHSFQYSLLEHEYAEVEHEHQKG